MSDATTDPYALAREAAARLRDLTGADTHDVALVMGSGWVPAAEMLGETAAEHPVTELPGFHAAAVAGHAGTFRSVASASDGPSSSSAAPTSTRAAGSPPSSTASVRRSRRGLASSC